MIMKNYLKSIALMFTATLFVACGSDDPVTDDKETDSGKELVADFDYVVEEGGTGKVTFTNKSQNATDYEWSFGDKKDGSSIMENPVYTYEATGTYKVTLTAIDAKGNYKSTEKEVEIVMNKPEVSITIDNKFDDWKDIPWRDDVTFDGGITGIKTAATDKTLYVLVKSNSEVYTSGTKIYIGIDMDNNRETGENQKGENRTGADVLKRVAGFFVWGYTWKNKPENQYIGWDWIKDGTWVEWVSTLVGNEGFYEWKIDLEYAKAQLLANQVFQDDELSKDPQFATKCFTDYIRMYAWFKNNINADGVFYGRVPNEKDVTFSIKLNEYVEKAN